MLSVVAPVSNICNKLKKKFYTKSPKNCVEKSGRLRWRALTLKLLIILSFKPKEKFVSKFVRSS
jgi:hypothetical protein